jgi:alkanesulfonate monooxygenase SsuD/methylene tetrahydromethanopterin reductase-like flavin-dependent oxidoreductase (luciferase family)
LPYFASKYADGLNAISSSLEECRAIITAAKNTADRLGRKELIISWQGFILIGRTQSELEDRIAHSARRRGMSEADFRKMSAERGYFVGTADECVERLREFAAIGVNNFVLILTGDTDTTPLEMFRDTVVPELR